MGIRTFWLNLGWLVMLVVTIAVPLVLDAFGRLTYFTSLGLWGIPILYLWPVFNMITAEGTGRRRRALRLSAGMIVVLGVVLDFLFGYLTLRFPGCSEPPGAGPYLLCLRPCAAAFRWKSFCSTRWDQWRWCSCTRVRTSGGSAGTTPKTIY